MQLCIGNAERCTNNFPESGRGLGHVTPTIFGIRSNISRKILEVETSNLIHDIVWGITSGRTKNFPAKWAWPTSRDPTIIGIRSKISRKLFQLVTSNLVRSFDCRVLHTVVYCGAVRSAILATAWLLVVIIIRESRMLQQPSGRVSTCFYMQQKCPKNCQNLL